MLLIIVLILILFAGKIFPGFSVAMDSVAVLGRKVFAIMVGISIVFVFFVVIPVLILLEDRIFHNSVFKSIKQRIFYSIVICLFFASLAVCYSIWLEERGYLIAVSTIYTGLWFHGNRYGVNRILHKTYF